MWARHPTLEAGCRAGSEQDFVENGVSLRINSPGTFKLLKCLLKDFRLGKDFLPRFNDKRNYRCFLHSNVLLKNQLLQKYPGSINCV